MSGANAPLMTATTWAAAGRLFSFGEGRVVTEQAAMEVKRLQIPCCLQEIRPSTLSSSSREGASFAFAFRATADKSRRRCAPPQDEDAGSRNLLHRLGVEAQEPRRVAAQDVALGLLGQERQVDDLARQVEIEVRPIRCIQQLGVRLDHVERAL